LDDYPTDDIMERVLAEYRHGAMPTLFIATSHGHINPSKPRTHMGGSATATAPTSLGLSPSVVPHT
jgi:hypothetical protein